MKYCGKCGCRLEDAAKFCERCGARQPMTVSVPAVSSPSPAAPVAAPPSSRHRVFLIVGIVVALMLAVAVGAGAALAVNHASRPVEATTSATTSSSKEKNVEKTDSDATDAAKPERNAVAGKDTGASVSPTPTPKPAPKKSYTATEARAMAQQGDFTAVAGKYCRKSGSDCLAIGVKGKVTLSSPSGDYGMYIGPDQAAWTQLHAEDVWEPPSGAAVELRGRDTDVHCSQGFTDYESCNNASASQADFDLRPLDIFWVPANTTLDALDGIAGSSNSTIGIFGPAADTTKTYLYWAAYHMNDAPDDDWVLYKTDQ